MLLLKLYLRILKEKDLVDVTMTSDNTRICLISLVSPYLFNCDLEIILKKIRLGKRPLSLKPSFCRQCS